MNEPDIQKFLETAKDVADGNIEGLINGSDQYIEMELNALFAAARAFVLYRQLYELRMMREREQAERERAAAQAAPSGEMN